MLLSFAFLAAAWRPAFSSQDAKITLTARSMAAPALVAKIASMSGRTLEVSRELAREQLVVKVQDVSVDDLLQKIADATHGQWEQTASGLRLARGAALTNSLAAKEHEHIMSGLKSEIARRLAEAASAPVDEASIKKQIQKLRLFYEEAARNRGSTTEGGRPRLDWEGVQKIQSGAPVAKTLLRLVGLTDLEAITRMPTGDGLVFSTNPTPVQRSFGPGGAQIVREFIKDQHDWRDKLDKVIGAASARRGEPVTVTMFVQVSDREPGDISLAVSLYALDAKGHSVSGHEGYELGSSPSSDDWYEEKPETLPKDGTFAFSAEGESLEKLVQMPARYYEGDAEHPQAPPPVPTAAEIDFFMHPEVHSLLEYRPSEALFALADRSKANLVADLPDDASVDSGIENGKGVYAYAKRDLTNEQEWGEKDGWVILTPRWPIFTTDMRTDRVVLGELTRMACSQPNLPIESVAYFTERLGDFRSDLWQNPIYRTNIQTLSGLGFTSDDSDEGGDPAPGARFYTALGAATRRQLAAGGKLPFQSLPPSLVKLVRRRLFGTGMPYNVEMTDESGAFIDGEESDDGPILGDGTVPDPMAARLHSFLDGQTYGQFATEATFLLGRGIPNDSYVTMDVQSSFILTGFSKEFPTGRVVTISELAYRMSKAGKEDNDMGALPDSFRVGNMTTYNFTVHFSPKYAYSTSVTETKIDPKSATYPLANLPAAVKAQIQEALKMMDGDGPPPNPKAAP